jgi:hypothetical protein
LPCLEPIKGTTIKGIVSCCGPQPRAGPSSRGPLATLPDFTPRCLSGRRTQPKQPMLIVGE